MISLDINDSLVPASDRLGTDRYFAITSAVNAALPNIIDGVITINYITNEEIKRLNRMYRGVDKITDVLSFASGIPKQSGEVGDVLISYSQAARQAIVAAEAIDGAGDIELECVDLVVHGILHCLGYDHELPEDADRMFPLQDAIVASSLSGLS